VKRKLFFFVLGCCIFNYFAVFANDSSSVSKSKLHFELSENIGKSIANQPTFPNVKACQLTEFSILRQCNGSELWHEHYNYPETGLTLLYGTLGNQKVLGNVAAAFSNINFEKNKGNKWVFQKRIGFGFAYFNNPYHLQKNRENIVIGSHVTAVACFTIGAKYRLSDYLSAHFGASYFHFSNAHYQLPNLGLNAVNFRFGLSYYPQKKQSKFSSPNQAVLNKRFHLNLKLGLGINERGGTLGPSNGPKYPIYLASVFVTKRYSPKASFQFGVEGNFNTGAHAYIVANSIFEDKEKLKSTTSIFFLGHEYLWKHLSFVVQGGVYMHNPLYRELIQQQKTTTSKQHLKAWITTKFGFQYYLKDTYRKFKNQIYIGSYVKANLGQADYWETSLGYCF
jgi:hypothetical protein